MNESMKTAPKPKPGEMVHGHHEMLHMLNARMKTEKMMNRRIKILYQNTKYHDQTQLTRYENPRQRT